MELDLGTGLREWIEVRHGDTRWYVTTLAERDRLLPEGGTDPAVLREQEAVDDVRWPARVVQCPGWPFRDGGAAVGFAVYVENQVHEQRYAGVEAGSSLERLVAASDRERHHLVSRIDSYGDTMINLIQLPQLTAELDEIASRKPELRVDVQALEVLIEEATRARGYLWISGD